ncbi:MAG: T9SS type A sorting domain-containing protein [Candidatus Kapabacteria bacterium]|jgi:hypothetical protein|nr:T9SS type A sorting domain-containing protein [Candidatus Kapabacteria bacterium]
MKVRLYSIFIAIFLGFCSALRAEELIEWEKVVMNMDSLSYFGQVHAKNDNEVFMLLPTGIYKYNNNEEAWERLDLPDNLIFENTWLSGNGGTFFTYAYEHTESLSKKTYLVYSMDNGVSWKIIDVWDLKFPDYDFSTFLFIDNNGNIWGLSAMKDREPNSHLIVNKFDFDQLTTTKMYELPKSFNKIYLTDSLTALLEYTHKPDPLNDTSSIVELQVHFTYNGTDWDSLFFDKYNTSDFDSISHYLSFYSFIVESNGSLISYSGASNLPYGSLIKIDLLNREMKILDKNFPVNSSIRKVNDTCFYKSSYYSYLHWYPSIFKSKNLINWELVASPYKIDNLPDSTSYMMLDFYVNTYWTVDSEENHYLFNKNGLFKLSVLDSSVEYFKHQGLEYFRFEDFAVDSKSNIVLVNNYFKENLIVINPDTKSKRIINHNFNISNKDFFKIMPNDEYVFDKYDFNKKRFGLYFLSENFSSDNESMVDDSTSIRNLMNFRSHGSTYLALAEVNASDSNYYKTVYTTDYGNSWLSLDNINLAERVYGSYIMNKDKHLIRIDSNAVIYKSEDSGNSWEIVCDDSDNEQLKFNEESNQLHSSTYNESNGTMLVKYKDYGPILFSLDHGNSWHNVLPENQAYSLIHKFVLKSKTDFSWVFLPFSFDSTFKFYLNTPTGIYCSFDTLKSFKNISSDIIEPSYIRRFKMGNDGKLYALNQRGLFRSKNKVNDVQFQTQFSAPNRDIYPIPANDEIYIMSNHLTNNHANNITVKIFDNRGVEIQSSIVPIRHENNVIRVDISMLPPGMYYIQAGDIFERMIKI